MVVWTKNDAGRNAPEKSTGIEQGKDKLQLSNNWQTQKYSG